VTPVQRQGFSLMILLPIMPEYPYITNNAAPAIFILLKAGIRIAENQTVAMPRPVLVPS